MSQLEPFPFVEVSGSSFEMGRQHGSKAASLIHRYLRWIETLTGKPRDELRRNAMRLLCFLQALSPRYVEEVQGLSRGADIPMADAVLCQARAEAAHAFRGGPPEGGCTAFAVTRSATASGTPLSGQNQDLEEEYGNVAIVLAIHPADGRPRATMVTFAGQLGYVGLNEHGVSHFANALYNCAGRPALPYYPLRRLLLEQNSVEDCVLLLDRYRACSAANFVLADGRGVIADVEARPERIAVFDDDHPDWRIHTNHYLTRDFLCFNDDTLPDSRPRLDRARQWLKPRWSRITTEVLKDFLADHDGGEASICRHGAKNLHSVAGYIADPANRTLHVRRGHGCDGVWTAYRV